MFYHKSFSSYLFFMFSVAGIVEKGESRGTAIGFPTVNINVGDVQQKDGVYAVLLEVGGKRLKGVANLGTAPTFSRNKRLLEAHVFDFSGDIYGLHVKLSFVAFIRDEKKFDSVKDLAAQIKKDVEKAKSLLEK